MFRMTIHSAFEIVLHAAASLGTGGDFAERQKPVHQS